MVLSMTGFGQAQTEEHGVSYRAEIRCVNNRYFKSNIKLPEWLQRFEVEIDRQLRSELCRGSVTYTLRVKDDSAAGCAVNVGALAQYVERLAEIAGRHPHVHVDLASLLELPGLCEPPELDEAALLDRFKTVQRLTAEAVRQVQAMRRAEGMTIQKDLEAQVALIRGHLGELRQRSPLVVEDYQRRLRLRVQHLLGSGSVELDKDVLAREVALFAERCDISEEISRLSSHLDQFAEACAGPEDAGRKLDFLAQELLREANTIGSKANDAEIARLVVEIKAAVDRIKEQVQNVG